MNRERVIQLRAALEIIEATGSNRFAMEDFFTGPGAGSGSLGRFIEELGHEPARDLTIACGTACCLAGLAQLLWAKDREERYMEAATFARAALGLDKYQADHWFYGAWTHGPLTYVTEREAIDFLDRELALDAELTAELEGA